jgi:hypothetical protein
VKRSTSVVVCVLGISTGSILATVCRADPLKEFPLQVMTEADKASLLQAISQSLDGGDLSKRFHWDNTASTRSTSPNRTEAIWTLKSAPEVAGKTCLQAIMNLSGIWQEEFVKPTFCRQENGGWDRLKR